MNVCASDMMLSCKEGTFGGASCIALNQRANCAALSRFGPMTGVWVVTVEPEATCGVTAEVTTAPVNEVHTSANALIATNRRGKRRRVIGGITISRQHRTDVGMLE